MPHAPVDSAAGDPLFRAVYDHASAGICVLDADGRVLHANAAVAQLLGCSDEALHALTLAAIAGAADRPADAALLERLMHGERSSVQLQRCVEHPDGLTVWLDVHVTSLRGDDGVLMHVLVFLHDITAIFHAGTSAAEVDARFRSLIENASDVVSILERDATMRYKSPAAERILGYPVAELEGRCLFDFVHPEDLDYISERFREVLRHPAEKLSYLFRFRHRDGSWRWLEGVSVNLLDDASVRGVVANSRDVTARRHAELKLAAYSDQLHRERALFEQLFESSPAAVALVDAGDRVLRINPEFTRLFGYTAAEAVGRTLAELIVPEEQRAAAHEITARAAEGARMQTETLRRHRDGRLVHVMVIGVPVRLDAGEVVVYGMYLDNTSQKEVEAVLEQQANRDPLTGLLNRRGFLAQLDREWERSARSSGMPLLIYIDLDDFKSINDVHGHLAGDRVLQEVTHILNHCSRKPDLVARMGGDEFAILCVETKEDAADVVCRRIHHAVDEFNAQPERAYRIRLSLGAVRAAPSVTSAEELLAEADRRMYEDKRSRRRGAE